MKGIVLAGGLGTRLYPLTGAVSKQLLPVYDKPMIYYSLSVLMMSGIRDILIISTPIDLPGFERLLGDGSRYGISLSYAPQESPDGSAQAFLVGEDFIAGDACALILGDNIFFGKGLGPRIASAAERAERDGISTIFGYRVDDPQRFGVVELGLDGRAISIEEKPENPKSNYAVCGLYFYDSRVCDLVKSIKPSARGELEVTDLNRIYLRDGSLSVVVLQEDCIWMDAGTIEALFAASNAIRALELSQGIAISAPEEIAYRNSWISRDSLLESARKYENSSYGAHLRAVAEGSLAPSI